MSELEETLKKDESSLLIFLMWLGSRGEKGLGQSHNDMVEKVTVSTLIWLVCEDRSHNIFKKHPKYSLQRDWPHHWYWYWVHREKMWHLSCKTVSLESSSILGRCNYSPSTLIHFNWSYALESIVVITFNLFPTPFWQDLKGSHIRLSYQHWGVDLKTTGKKVNGHM